jgi:hypothetical protein
MTQPSPVLRIVADRRPIQPSIRRQLAQFLMMLDPRCDWPEHNTAATVLPATPCTRCHLDLAVYAKAAPAHWPEP